MNANGPSISSIKNARFIFLGVVLLLVAGCNSIGPKTIPRDRFSYSTALAESWKSQMLLNLVKTRYLDLPIYLEVGQIVSGYSLETGVEIFGQVSPQSMRGDTFGGLGTHGTFTDRPTITYSPLTGERFLQSFLTPIHPAKVFALVQSGYAADFILELSVESLNGLRNRPVSIGSRQKADPEFFRALALLREIQDAGAVGLRVDQPTNGQPATSLFFRSDKIEPQIQAKIAEMRELLGLTPGQSSFRLVQSPLRGARGELGVASRSLMQIMAALAQCVEVPPGHQQRKLTPPVAGIPAGEESLLRVHSGAKAPAGVFAAVPYEGEWFWIASDDWKSKRTFSSILFLFTLADSGSDQKMPTITIPAQ
jgi:hypothetical protein